MNPNKLTPGHNLMWESSRMMLPEHKMRIREHRRELTKRTKPILDEQQMELFSQIISDAIERDAVVTIQLFHPYRDHYVTGKIAKIDQLQNRIKMITESDFEWVPFHDIVNVSEL